MTICKKSPWWLAPALLLALGCGSDTQVAKFEVEDDDAKTSTAAVESNKEFSSKGKSEDEPEMTTAANGADEGVAATQQEPDEPKKPSAKKPAAKEEGEPKEKSLADLELPKDGKAEDYEKLLNEAIAIPPTTRAEQQKLVALVKECVKKILELEKDKETARWKQAFGFELQLKVGELMPLMEAVFLAKEKAQADEAVDALQKAVDAYLEPIEDRPADEVVVQGIVPLAQLLSRLPIPAISKIHVAVIEKFVPKFEASDNAEMKELAKELLRSIRLPKLVGDEMKLTGKTADGKDFDLNEWKGKVVLVDFWATWCEPCKQEYPNMLKNYEKYHDKGFEIVGVSGDDQLSDLTEYVSAKKVPWPNLFTEGGHEAAREYEVSTIPRMILIGRDGKVISVEARGAELTRLLEEQFASAGAAEGEKKEEKTDAKGLEKKEPAEEKPAEEKKDEPKS